MDLAVRQEFLRMVVEKQTKDCWSWAGEHDQDLRPIFRGDKAYRVMYRLRVGSIPGQWHVHHKCGNSSCVNPRHLIALPERAHRRVHSYPHEAESIYATDWSAFETSTSERLFQDNPFQADPIWQANERELERVRRVVEERAREEERRLPPEMSPVPHVTIEETIEAAKAREQAERERQKRLFGPAAGALAFESAQEREQRKQREAKLEQERLQRLRERIRASEMLAELQARFGDKCNPVDVQKAHDHLKREPAKPKWSWPEYFGIMIVASCMGLFFTPFAPLFGVQENVAALLVLVVSAVLAAIPPLRRKTAYPEAMKRWTTEMADLVGQPLTYPGAEHLTREVELHPRAGSHKPDYPQTN